MKKIFYTTLISIALLGASWVIHYPTPSRAHSREATTTKGVHLATRWEVQDTTAIETHPDVLTAKKALEQAERAVRDAKRMLAGAEQAFREAERALTHARSRVKGTPNPQPSVSVDRHLLELPAPTKGRDQYLVTHYVGSKVNYSLEYDASKHHARWVAFTFDAENSKTGARRSDAWGWDPKLPQKLSTERWFKGSSYSRGHLVASSDRVYTLEANKQTFYYSNMSPQLQAHNAGIWQSLEDRVQRWGRSDQHRKVLYVAKGGTISDNLIGKTRVKGKIVVPTHYWMALLVETPDGQWHSIAFLTEHRKYERSESNIRSLALSVDELEAFIGIDLFHKLPDALESVVESEHPNSDTANRFWWR